MEYSLGFWLSSELSLWVIEIRDQDRAAYFVQYIKF